jgi:para-aminobenzoate synthetase / 4-amino-4-deoxychorismate lyase
MLPFDPRKAFVWLEDSRGSALAGASWLFTGLVGTETADDGDVREALGRLKGSPDWVAGWMSYEAGYALEAKLQAMEQKSGSPLMWFGRFQSRQLIEAESVESLWRYPLTTALPVTAPTLTPDATNELHYKKAVTHILDYIAAGDVYQINFTYPLTGETTLDPVRLYRQLRESQRVPYGALIHDGEGNWVLSFSPELFFRIDKNIITAKPMKGTARRMPLLADDKHAAAELQADTKNRAENLMIVDLLRNDISKIARLGSVAVPSLYDIETYTTVHQLTSTVTAQLNDSSHATDVLAALFPCGSVTGAPKIRAMEIIRELEPGPRGVYCGALGWIGPDGDAVFNVPIRTLALAENKITFGLGSGIVADSNPADEWQECQLKGQFISRAIPPFDLFETLLWRPEYGWWEMDAHLNRLSDSAVYWGFPVDRQKWQEDLSQVAASFKAAMRVRFLLGRAGATSIQSAFLPPSPDQSVKLTLSPNRMRSDNPFLYHKTTHRAFYDDERQRLVRETGCLECLFLNERNEITEGSFTTLFIRKNGNLLTPAQQCGLLPGILRKKLIAEEGCTEAILTLEDIKSADTILIGNSVRGLIGAVLV